MLIEHADTQTTQNKKQLVTFMYKSNTISRYDTIEYENTQK